MGMPDRTVTIEMAHTRTVLMQDNAPSIGNSYPAHGMWHELSRPSRSRQLQLTFRVLPFRSCPRSRLAQLAGICQRRAQHRAAPITNPPSPSLRLPRLQHLPTGTAPPSSPSFPPLQPSCLAVLTLTSRNGHSGERSSKWKGADVSFCISQAV